MRVGQFASSSTAEPWAAVVDGDEVVRLYRAAAGAGVDLPRDLVSVMGTWNWREKVDIAVSYARETGTGVHDRADVTRRAPVTDPGKIVGVGLNYRDHAEESGGEPPESPVLFSKFSTAIVGPGDDVEWDSDLTSAVDFEAELVVVVGDRARNVSAEEALDHVAGYTVGNDVSARDLQFADDQWVRGKSLDTFAPVGPDVVTPDEVGDVHDLDIWAEVNDERLQDSNTSQLIFDVGEVVSFCSRAFTLEPGDLVYTGTPAGVGYFRDPKVLLDDGDTVTVGVEGVGELTNECRHV
jgi:2-keto-4-pentenoate hydratase/2-oxohepta-3-ene-1,7-dioic acid hydratase in catechol pathway